MQWLNKNNVIIILSISLVSTLVIKGEAELNNRIENRESIKSVMDSKPLNRELEKGLNLVKTHPAMNDNEIIQGLNHKAPLSVLQTLSYIWVHIDKYNKHEQIMGRVDYLAKVNNDKRISGLATLVSGKLLQQEITLVKNIIDSNEQWEALEQESLVTQEDQSESDYEKLDSSSSVEDSSQDFVDNADREQYIDNLLSHNNSPKIDEIEILLQDIDEEVSVAAVDTLITFLNQGIGDPKEIIEVIEENITLLDEFQIQSYKEILNDVDKIRED